MWHEDQHNCGLLHCSWKFQAVCITDQVSASQAKNQHGRRRNKVGNVCAGRGQRLTLIAACMIHVAALVSLSTGSNPGSSQDMFMLACMLYAGVHACTQVLPVLAQNGLDVTYQKVLKAHESRGCLLNIAPPIAWQSKQVVYPNWQSRQQLMGCLSKRSVASRHSTAQQAERSQPQVNQQSRII